MTYQKKYDNLVEEIKKLEQKIHPNSVNLKNKNEKKSIFYVGLSLEIFCGIAIGVILGYYIGIWFFKTSKSIKIILIIIFTILGFIAGLFNLLKKVKHLK
jgi:F0F1-type ATP synthase assembly protein I